jgi:hypothetical protein
MIFKSKVLMVLKKFSGELKKLKKGQRACFFGGIQCQISIYRKMAKAFCKKKGALFFLQNEEASR